MTTEGLNEGSPGKKLPQHLAAFAAAGGALSTGTMLGWSVAIQEPFSNKTTIKEPYSFPISDPEFAWLASCVLLSAVVGCIVAVGLLEWTGRKWTLVISSIPLMTGWAFLLLPKNILMLFIGRTLLGFGAGLFSVATPIYIGETAHCEMRGILLSYFHLLLAMGVLLVYTLGITVSNFVLTVICGIIPLIFGVILCFVPESPAYLVFKDRQEDALKSLQWLRGKLYDSQLEVDSLNYEHVVTEAISLSFRKSLERMATIRGIIIAVTLMVFQQMTGIYIVIFYVYHIFEKPCIETDVLAAPVRVGLFLVVASLAATIFSDYVGRQFSLFMSALLVVICLGGLGTYYYLEEENSDFSFSESIKIVLIQAFLTFYAFGLGPVPWIMSGEIFTQNLKSALTAIATSVNWLLAFVVVKLFPAISRELSTGSILWFFMCMCMFAILVVAYVPETAHKTFTEIQMILAKEEFGTRESLTTSEPRRRTTTVTEVNST